MAKNIENAVLGYQGRDVPDEYIVEIHDQRPASYVSSQGTGVYRGTSKYKFKEEVTVRALLQHDISIKTTARWGALTAASFAPKMVAEAVLAATGRALITKWGSRQIWTGTSPLDFTLNLRFEAINDSEKEVLAPCRELQRMILPYTRGAHGNQVLMLPPGPLAIGSIRKFLGAADEGEIISIRIGKFMTMSKVIILEVNHNIKNRWEEGGNPVSADVSVHFQTYEVLTKNSLEDELYHVSKRVQGPATGAKHSPAGARYLEEKRGG